MVSQRYDKAQEWWYLIFYERTQAIYIPEKIPKTWKIVNLSDGKYIA